MKKTLYQTLIEKEREDKSSLVLRIKSWLYRRGFPYMAYREENDYVNTDQFWVDLERMRKRNKDLTIQNCYSILVGGWQCEHKFYRSFR